MTHRSSGRASMPELLASVDIDTAGPNLRNELQRLAQSQKLSHGLKADIMDRIGALESSQVESSPPNLAAAAQVTRSRLMSAQAGFVQKNPRSEEVASVRSPPVTKYHPELQDPLREMMDEIEWSAVAQRAAATQNENEKLVARNDELKSQLQEVRWHLQQQRWQNSPPNSPARPIIVHTDKMCQTEDDLPSMYHDLNKVNELEEALAVARSWQHDAEHTIQDLVSGWGAAEELHTATQLGYEREKGACMKLREQIALTQVEQTQLQQVEQCLGATQLELQRTQQELLEARQEVAEAYKSQVRQADQKSAELIQARQDAGAFADAYRGQAAQQALAAPPTLTDLIMALDRMTPDARALKEQQRGLQAVRDSLHAAERRILGSWAPLVSEQALQRGVGAGAMLGPLQPEEDVEALRAQISMLQQELEAAKKAAQDGARWFRGEPPNHEAQRLKQRLATTEATLADLLTKQQQPALHRDRAHSYAAVEITHASIEHDTASASNNSHATVGSMLEEVTTYPQLIRSSADRDYIYDCDNADDLVGIGAKCSVYKARPKAGNKADVAIKIMDVSRNKLESMLKEFEIMQLCHDHPHVVKLEAVYYCNAASELQAVMELMAKETLFHLISMSGRLSTAQASAALSNIASALAHIHNMGFIHRDVKPENILLRHPNDASSAALSDFDSAIANSASKAEKCTVVGTSGYAAPELMESIENMTEHTTAVDIWSLGVVLYVMLAGKTPFPQSETKQAKNAVAQGLLEQHKSLLDTTQPALDILENMVQVEPSRRVTAQEVCKCDFLTGVPTASNSPLEVSTAWPGAKKKWKQLSNVTFAAFALRRSYQRRAVNAEQSRTRSPSVAVSDNATNLISDEALEAVLHKGTIAEIDKKYGKRKALASNENCEVFSASFSKAGKVLSSSAIKVIECDASDHEEYKILRDEMKIFATVGKHKYIVTLREAIMTLDTYQVWIVMDLAQGGELFDSILKRGPYSEHDAQRGMLRVADALCHVHSHGVIHRDIKPENILIQDKTDRTSLLLSDFDMSIVDSVSPEDKHGLVGTIGYTAPELGSTSYSYNVDVWSTGVVLFVMLMGHHPWPMHKPSHIGVKSLHITEDHMSESAADLIKSMLCVEPKQRFSSQQVLEHQWMVTPLDSTNSNNRPRKRVGKLERAPKA